MSDNQADQSETTRCDCGQRTAQECAEMPSRHCGLWDRTTAQYRGPEADARAAAIQATLGTDAERLTDVVWLLRYTTVKNKIQWPTHEELLEMRRD